MKSVRKEWPYATGLLLVLAVTVLAYLPSLSGPWVFDDMPHIVNNPAVHLEDLSMHELREAALESPQPTRALANASFALVYLYADDDPLPQHEVNLGIHLLATIIAFFLLREIFLRAPAKDMISRPRSLALIGAAVFTLHPVNTQSVSYIVQRMNLMAGLFVMAALLCWLRGSEKKSEKAGISKSVCLYFFFPLSALAGCLCKENAVSLVLLVPVLDLVLSGKSAGQWLRQRWKVPLIAAAAGVVVACLYFAMGASFMGGYEQRDFSLFERMLTQPGVVLWYITLWAYPAGFRLSLEHHFPVSTGLFSPPYTAFAIIAIAGATLAALYYVKKEPLVCGGWLWFVAGLLLESSVLPLEMVFEHRIYLPGLGLYIAAAGLFSRLQIKKSALPLLVIVLAFFTLLTFARNRVWQSGERLWKDAAEKAPQKPRPFANLCSMAYGENEMQRAVRMCEAALRRDSEHPRALYNLGLAYKELGKLDSAQQVLERAALAVPSEGFVRYHLGQVRYKNGEYAKAVDSFQKAVELMPGDAFSYYLLGKSYARLSRNKESLEAYEKALENADDKDAQLQTLVRKAMEKTRKKLQAGEPDQ